MPAEYETDIVKFTRRVRIRKEQKSCGSQVLYFQSTALLLVISSDNITECKTGLSTLISAKIYNGDLYRCLHTHLWYGV
jgi:hypothetical protein